MTVRSTQGSVRFRKGAWRLKVFMGHNPRTRKDEYAYGTHHAPNTAEGKRAAKLAAAKLLVDKHAERSAQPAFMRDDERTISDILAAYLTWGTGRSEANPDGKKKPFSPSSLRTTHNVIEGRIKPFTLSRGSTLGSIPAYRLTAAHLQGFYDVLLDPQGLGYAESYIARIHGVIHAALARAVKKGWLASNVAAVVEDKPSQEAKNIELPTETEMMLLFQAVNGNALMEAWLLLAISFGARRGAMCALRWHDLDLDAGYVTFSRAISDGGKTYGIVEKGLKADNPFTATLNPVEVDRLVSLRDLQRRKFGPGWTEDHFVFSANGGTTHLHPSTATHWFEVARDQAGLKITLHQLKHYGVTNLLKDKVPLIEVAARVGTNQRTLERRYMQWMRGLDDRSASAMSGLQSRLLAGGAKVVELDRAV